jgi:thiol-disulfide isomerase/thioredoxin
MKKVILKTLCIFMLALFVMSMSGAAATSASSSGGKVVQVTQLDQINKALQKGPVFLRVGASWCHHCQDFAPTLKGLAKEYRGKVTFMSADIDKSPKLAVFFGVDIIPDCCVIVDIKDGKYIYMKQNGKTTTVKSAATIYRDQKKSVYEKVLNFAIKY